MKYHLKASLLLILILTTAHLVAQNEGRIITKIYKQIDTVALDMEIHYPKNYESGQQLPAIIFYFGGGWNGGNIGQFRPHAQYFSSRGIIAVLADYRVKSRQGTTPFDAVKDAKSAIRYLRKHHELLGIDPDKIIAAGGSAGGHLAAATGNVSGRISTGKGRYAQLCIPILPP